MNKIHKVIWNESLGTYVAVAEIESSHSSSSSRRTRVRALLNAIAFTPIMGVMTLAVVGALATPQQAHAAYTAGGATASNGIGIGNAGTANGSLGTKALGSESVAIGVDAVADGSRSIAIGGTAKTSGSHTVDVKGKEVTYSTPSGNNQAIAIGYESYAYGSQSVGLGANVRAVGNSSIAIGGDDLDAAAGTSNNSATAKAYKDITGDNLVRTYDNKVGATNQYFGTSAGHAAVAIGVQAGAMGDLSTSFGTRTQADGLAATALGVGATANKDGSIALGAGSQTSTNAVAVTNVTIGGIFFDGFTGTAAFAGNVYDAGRQVSVGSQDKERQIKHVAPGEITRTSTDAINGSQLYAVASVLGDVRETAEKGWKLKADLVADSSGVVEGSTLTHVKPDDEVHILAGNNIALTQAGATLSIATKSDLVVDSVTAGDTVVNRNGLSFNTGPGVTAPSITVTGINAGKFKVTEVAVGQVSEQSTDAVNGSQLYSVVTAIGGNTVIGADGKIVTSNVGGTGANNIHDAISHLNQGFNVIANADEGVVNAGDTGNVLTKVGAGNTVTFIAGKNIELEQTGATFNIATKSDVNFNSVTSGSTLSGSYTELNNAGMKVFTEYGGSTYTQIGGSSIEIADGTGNNSLLKSGAVELSSGSTNVTLSSITGDLTGLENKDLNNPDFATQGRAATEEQLKAALSNVGGFDVIAAGQTGSGAVTGSVLHGLDAGQTLSFIAGNNIALTQSGATFTIATKEEVAFTKVTTGDSVLSNTGLTIASQAGNTVSITNVGVNLGNQIVNGVSDGLVADQSKQAVNGSQLYAANQNIANNLGGNAGVDAATGVLTAPTYQVTNAAGNAVVYTNAAGDTTSMVANNVGDALKQMNTYVNTGFDVQQTGTTKGTVTPGDKINFVNGALTTAKVTTEANGVTDITFDVNAQSVVDAAQLPVVYTNAAGDRVYKVGNTWNTKADGTGSVVNAGDVIASMNNAAGQTNSAMVLGNVAEGAINSQSKQAVNGSQLYAANQSIANNLGGNAGVDAATGVLTSPTYQVTNAAGVAVTYTNAAGDTLAVAANNVGDALTQMNTYVNTGFDVQQAGTTKGTVTPGDKINFVNGALTTAKVTTEANGVTDITFDVNAQSVVDAAQLPVVYTNAAGDRVYKVGNTWNTKADGTGSVVNAGDVIASMNNADGQTNSAMVLGNVAEGAINSQSKQAVNGSQLYASNQSIANNLGGNAGVDAATGVLTAPTYQVTNAAGVAVTYTNAAGDTLAVAANNVGDALTQMNTYVNTGFDVQQTGTTKGTVTPGDKINFVNGALTTAKVTTEANGVTDITFDVNAQSVVDAAQLPVVYTNAAGDRVYKVGNTWNTKADGTGSVVNAGDVIASMNNAAGQTNSAMVLGNVAEGAINSQSKQAVNGSQLYAANQSIANNLGGNAGVDAATGVLTSPTYQVTNAAGVAVTYTNAAGDTLAVAANNVGDALTQMNTYVNTGFDVQQAGTTKGTVTPGDKINFVNGALTTAKVTTEANGVTDITFDVNAQSVVDAAQLPVVYTNAAGDRVYKVGNTWNTKADGTGSVVNAGDVIASMNNAAGQTNSAMVLGNVAEGAINSQSKQAVNGSQLYASNQSIANNLGGNAGVDAATGVLTAPTYQVTNAAGVAVTYTNAAGDTLAVAANNVGDALTQMNTYVNTGFDVQQAGTTKGTVTPGDKINFVNGALTTAKVTTEANGVTDITFDVNAQSVVDAAQLPVVYTNAAGDRVYKVGNTWNTKADGTGSVVNAGDVIASMNNAAGQTNSAMVLGNVAEGAINSQSKQAVNGSQLYAANQNIANNLGGNAGVDATTGVLTAPTYQVTNAAGVAVTYTNAAGDTLAVAANNVGDALTQMNTYVNAGFDVQQTGTTKGTVTPGDKINFVNGALTTAKVTTEANGVTDITFDVNAQSVVDAAQLPVVYTNAAGDRVYKVGNTWNTKADGTGSVVNAGDVIASMNNAAGQTNSAMVLGNVAEGAINSQSKQAVNGSQLYAANQNIANNLGGNAGVDATTGVLTAPTYQVTNAAGVAVTYTNAAGDTLAVAANNVGDALTQMNTYVNAGFDVQQTGTTKGTVTPGDKINFVNGALTTAKVTTEVNGVTDITFDVNAQNVVDAAQLPVVYTNAAGDRVYKVGNTWNTKADGTGGVVNAGNVIASMNNADGQTNSAMVLGNVAAGMISGSSTDAINGSQLYALGSSTAGSLGGGSTFNTVTGKVEASLAVNGNTYSNVQDALNDVNSQVAAGWNLTTNGGAAHNVGPNGQVDLGNTDQNIVISNHNGNVTFDLSKNIQVDSVTSGDTLGGTYSQFTQVGFEVNSAQGSTLLNQQGLSFTDAAGLPTGPVINSNGINAGNLLITNVAAGAIGAGSRDAVNGSQIHDLVGAGAYQDANGNVTPTIQDIGGTGATNIHDAFQAVNVQTKAAKTEVVQGDNITVTPSIGSAGQDVYTVATKKDLVLDSVKIDNGQGQSVTLNKTGTTVSNGSQSAHYGADGLVAKDAATGNQTVVNQDGLSFKDGNGNQTGPVINQNGIDAGGKQVTNVAAGVNDNDAVNVYQLNQYFLQQTQQTQNVQNVVGDVEQLFDTFNVQGQNQTDQLNIIDTINAMNTTGIQYHHTNSSNAPGRLGNTNDSSAGGNNSSAIGVDAIIEAGADSSVAFGHGTTANSAATSSVVIGHDSVVGGASSVAIGHGAQALGNQSISIGTGNVVTGNNSGAIGDPSYIDADNAYGIGNNNKIDANQSFVLGNEVTIGTAAADMKAANGATFQGSVALGHGTTVDAPVATTGIKILATDTQERAFAGTAPVGTVSVGAAKAERTITNVAAGRINADSTDAINGSQLYQTNEALGQLANGGAGVIQYSNANTPTIANGGVASNNLTLVGGSPATVDVNGDGVIDANDGTAPVILSNVAAGTAPTDAVNVGQLQQMGNTLNNRINAVEKEARAGTATAIAVANLPQVYLPGKSGVSMATGVYEGQVGYAVGYSAISDGGKWVFKASATGSANGAVGAGAGMLYMFE